MILLILSISAVIIASYLAGSLPTAYIAGKVLKKIDIRQHGSGNVGATNALRVLGTKIGITVMIIDILKGVFAVMLARMLLQSEWQIVLAGLFAVIGHIFTCFLGFKGGKGVATAAGVCAALFPLNFYAVLFVFIIVLILTKYVSLSSILAALILFILQSLRLYLSTDLTIERELTHFVFILIMVSFIIVKHIPNIKRLIQGNENKISFKKK